MVLLGLWQCYGKWGVSVCIQTMNEVIVLYGRTVASVKWAVVDT